jgi:predicted nucleotidyltransferase
VTPDLPADVALLLDRLQEALLARGGLVGVYLYGSLVTGDFSPARSDIDVLVLLEREPDAGATSELRELHATLAAAHDPARRLHCLYASARDAADPAPLRTYWYGDRMTQWQVKLLTQAELAAAGVALYGPWPPPGLGPVALADLQAAVREESMGYWRRVARRRRLWLKDTWVDFGLVTLPRAEALLTAGDLITKSEAIGRLPGFGVPAALADQIRRRRDGEDVAVGPLERIVRAHLARRLMRRGLRRLGRGG